MRASSAIAALLALFPGPAMALEKMEPTGSSGKLTFYGSVGVEAEDYQYESEYGTRDRTRFRTRFDLNGRGFIWDPRFAVFDAGVTLQNESVQTSENDTGGNGSYNMLGYRINTTWFANKPYPLTVYANRTQSTMSDFWSPSYELTTDSMGARWGLENRWLGRSSFYIDRASSKSDSSLVSRSDQNLSLGMDASQKLLPKQWGESDITYGYRHTAWDEQVYGGSQRQDYFYLNDRTLFGDKTNLTANLTYYNRSDQWGYSGLGLQVMESKFLGFNSMLTMQQTENLRHFYSIGLGMNDTGGANSTSHNFSGGVNYRLSPRWQVTGMLGLSGSSTEASTTSLSGINQNQDTSTVTGSGAVMYSNILGNYLVNGGYTLAMTQTDSSATSGQPQLNNTTHTGTLGYSRINSPLFSDALQLRVSQTMGEPKGSESNIRYSVTSMLTQKDMLQGTAEYRRYQQEYVVGTFDASNLDYYYYSLDSQSARLDLGWLHRFSEADSVMFSAGITSGTSQNVALDTRYAQARAIMRLRSALHWTALARAEQIEGTAYISGQKLTLESDLNYRIGKWQASLRYRLRDAKQEYMPFREQSLILMLRRDYGFRL